MLLHWEVVVCKRGQIKSLRNESWKLIIWRRNLIRNDTRVGNYLQTLDGQEIWTGLKVQGVREGVDRLQRQLRKHSEFHEYRKIWKRLVYEKGIGR